MSDEEKELRKQAWKEAMREFLSEQRDEVYKTLGKWILYRISTIIALLILLFCLKNDDIRTSIVDLIK